MSHYRPHPAYKDSGVESVGVVPEHWDAARVARIGPLRKADHLAAPTGERDRRSAEQIDLYIARWPIFCLQSLVVPAVHSRILDRVFAARGFPDQSG